LTLAALVIAVLIPSMQGKTFAGAFLTLIAPSQNADSPRMARSSAPLASVPTLASSATATEPVPSLSPTAMLSPTLSVTPTVVERTSTSIPTESPPQTYRLQRGEYPYCIARRFNVDPGELLVLNRMQNRQTFYTGMALQIPQTGHPFPGERRLKDHPTNYTVSTWNKTIHTIACEFGDIDPLAIAQANQISVDSILFTGQQLIIP
jgi:LysM repeat protein